MNTAGIHRWLVLSAMALMFALAGSTRAADAEDVQQRVLKLNSITGNDAIIGKVRELIKDAPGTEKMLTKAEEMLKSNPKAFQYNGASILARAAAGLKKYELSLRFFKLCKDLALKVQSWNKLSDAYEGQLLILTEMKKYEEAEKLCQEFLETEGSEDLEKAKPFIMEQMIQIKTRQGKIQEALKMTEALVKLDEGGWYFVRLKGWVLQQAGKNADAVTAYQDALEKIEKNEKMKPEEQQRWAERLRYILSSVYVDMEQIDKAADQLKALLKKKPDNPTFNNDLGYIWADHDKNLDEAEKLIRKAIEEDRKERKKETDLAKEDDKDKAAYLDSLAWVLYKKKQYQEAKKYMLEAVQDKDEGQHIEILDHLADVHMALGEKAEAIAVWKKCLEVDANSKRELKRRDEVEQKLKAAEKK